MQWSAMEWIDGMQCSGVECNGCILIILVILGINLVVFVQTRKKVNCSTRRRQRHLTIFKQYFFSDFLFLPGHKCPAPFLLGQKCPAPFLHAKNGPPNPNILGGFVSAKQILKDKIMISRKFPVWRFSQTAFVF